MFVVYSTNNTIVVKPSELTGGSNETIYKLLQTKYLFKIIENEGLCVEIISYNIKECVIVNGQGDYQFDVEAKLALFKPCKSEILVGEVERCLAEGIIVSLGFTQVFIPASSLNEPCRYDKKERIWIWMYENLEFLYEKGEKIRFQIESVHFEKNALEVDGESYYLIVNLWEIARKMDWECWDGGKARIFLTKYQRLFSVFKKFERRA